MRTPSGCDAASRPITINASSASLGLHGRSRYFLLSPKLWILRFDVRKLDAGLRIESCPVLARDAHVMSAFGHVDVALAGSSSCIARGAFHPQAAAAERVRRSVLIRKGIFIEPIIQGSRLVDKGGIYTRPSGVGKTCNSWDYQLHIQAGGRSDRSLGIWGLPHNGPCGIQSQERRDALEFDRGQASPRLTLPVPIRNQHACDVSP
jgi:hypothetical protein